MFDKAGGRGKPKVGQVAIAYDPDRDAAIERAHDQFRWFGLGWKVNADLPNPDSFEGASQFVTREQVADALSCGPDVEAHVEAIKPFLDAGFTEVAVVQIGARPPGAVHGMGRARATARAALTLSRVPASPPPVRIRHPGPDPPSPVRIRHPPATSPDPRL